MDMDDILSLEIQYKFYSEFHKNDKNQLIHFICIPLIVFTTSIFGCYSGELISLPGNSYFVSEFNLSALLTTIYSFYYIKLNMDLGLKISGLLWLNQIITYWLYCLFPGIWLNALYLHIACWLSQIVGHVYFEQNSPAFLTSITQSFLIAPFLVFIHLLDVFEYDHGLEFVNDKYVINRKIKEKIDLIKSLGRRIQDNTKPQKQNYSQRSERHTSDLELPNNDQHTDTAISDVNMDTGVSDVNMDTGVGDVNCTGVGDVNMDTGVGDVNCTGVGNYEKLTVNTTVIKNGDNFEVFNKDSSDDPNDNELISNNDMDTDEDNHWSDSDLSDSYEEQKFDLKEKED
jgi:uncharacterized membrane protein YGL010W